MDPTILVIVIVFALVLGYLLFSRPPAVFIVQVQAGSAVAKEGTVTAAFLDEITEQCQAAGVQTGELRGLQGGRRIRLWFSQEFPPELQQRLRNWWILNGWHRSPSRK
jgi:hypothetical protein